MKFTWNLAILLLYTSSRELAPFVHIKSCTLIFIAALFLIAPNYKQPECPLTNKLINKIVWYIYILEHYSALKGMKY